MPSRRRPLPLDIAVDVLQKNRGYSAMVWTCRTVVVLGLFLGFWAVKYYFGSNAWAWSAFAAAAALYFVLMCALCTAPARLLTDGRNLADAYLRDTPDTRVIVRFTRQVVDDFANPLFDRLPPLY
ncbi:hypothetical protein AB0I28_35770 [Phytomonospora sp. NPDC050363]|uniref:hypothetical protein n=1 Tax=Phytomonospora sp. NPDC050363 TaxID=3155642 RepID=UPI0033C40DD4